MRFFIIGMLGLLVSGCGMTPEQIQALNEVTEQFNKESVAFRKEAQTSTKPYINKPTNQVTFGRHEHDGQTTGTYYVNTPSGYRLCTVSTSGIAYCP